MLHTDNSLEGSLNLTDSLSAEECGRCTDNYDLQQYMTVASRCSSLLLP